MARPNKAADRRRSERFEVRLTIDEAHELVTRAINTGLSTSDYIRKMALGDHALEQQATPDRAALINAVSELDCIGQLLLRVIRSGRYADMISQMAALNATLDRIKTISGTLIKSLP